MPKNIKIIHSPSKRPLQKPASAFSFRSPNINSTKPTSKKPYKRPIQKPSKRTISQHYAPPTVRSKKTFSGWTVLMKLFFVLGSLLLIMSLAWHFNQTIQLAYFTPKVVPIKKVYAVPTQLKIHRVGIDLPIEETAIHNNVWQISQNGASHLTVSARPGENGAIIMYGHNTNERFGPIRWLIKGDTIELLTADGKRHTYTISQTMKVSPDQMDVFTQEKGENLILYTCDGFADLERFVIIAKPQR